MRFFVARSLRRAPEGERWSPRASAEPGSRPRPSPGCGTGRLGARPRGSREGLAHSRRLANVPCTSLPPGQLRTVLPEGPRHPRGCRRAGLSTRWSYPPLLLPEPRLVQPGSAWACLSPPPGGGDAWLPIAVALPGLPQGHPSPPRALAVPLPRAGSSLPTPRRPCPHPSVSRRAGPTPSPACASWFKLDLAQPTEWGLPPGPISALREAPGGPGTPRFPKVGQDEGGETWEPRLTPVRGLSSVSGLSGSPGCGVDVVSGCAGQETRGLSGQRGVAGQTLRMASRSQELCNSQG